eukprot:TRINITY_DN4135_c1_g1_i2.p1 TRINITY_DN4135_c1_g1~~TRINITY_DN4135_c1_g1_i2.p1  ORF type:complete len:191 (-),score=50.66 TRINITY_DN4135_c1_g1_i2:328-900(-)
MTIIPTIPSGSSTSTIPQLPNSSHTTNNKKTSSGDVLKSLLSLYKSILIHSESKICKILDLFTDQDNYPILFFCNNGKDEAGVIAALILSILGVDDQLIIEDYHTSNNRVPENSPIYEYLQQIGRVDHFSDAPKEVMTQLLVWLKKHYGSVPEYLNHIGVTLQKQDYIRHCLLQPVKSTTKTSGGGGVLS